MDKLPSTRIQTSPLIGLDIRPITYEGKPTDLCVACLADALRQAANEVADV
jgi:hypothetical protein